MPKVQRRMKTIVKRDPFRQPLGYFLHPGWDAQSLVPRLMLFGYQVYSLGLSRGGGLNNEIFQSGWYRKYPKSKKLGGVKSACYEVRNAILKAYYEIDNQEQIRAAFEACEKSGRGHIFNKLFSQKATRTTNRRFPPLSTRHAGFIVLHTRHFPFVGIP
jgi:hypothetical protein